MVKRPQFLYPYARYRGTFTPENLLFNANLQEFSYRVMYIANLETAGKLPPQEAYQRLENLWEKLKASRPQPNLD